ncbi:MULTISPECIES: diguanylate cyclase [unclassified Pseudomonas]|jgi:diguanylate cyclase (GGDEF)-like protein|uniref:diguanylate cyclase n=1 Tax=unclassified Pseudomonas TaxID=196821 RepID=UPI0004B4F12F|nr:MULTISPECIES: diguanylate cyclase [unclassified Pseudomonas]MBV7563827.1 diguanylate cyclase [Pseudomonas sp. sia0905]PZW68724.1 diguanylate cyclase (GGDEF)-like protein [Pseudomonas sp. URMO17WK12:I1]
MERATTILIVDDDVSAVRALSKAISGLGQVLFATQGDAAVELARQQQPDLILLDAQMPGISGFEVCRILKGDPSTSNIPVIFVTAHTEASMEEEGLELGAVDFIGKPIRPAIVAARVKTHLHLKLAMDQLNRQAQTDGMTGLANRRALDQSIEREWQSVLRTQRAFSLLLLDIDFFKRYNDHYGHLMGDECLSAVARVLARCAERPMDLAARYGGEEFAIVLPETTRDGACRVADKVIEHVRALNIAHATSELGVVTVSVGVASFDAQSAGWSLLDHASANPPELLFSAAQLLSVADKALYAAKQSGRNSSRFEAIEARAFDEPRSLTSSS